MFPIEPQRGAHHHAHPADDRGYSNHSSHPPPSPYPPHPRADRKLAFGQLRQAVSSRLCDLLDQAGIHATRVVSGRRFVKWDTVPNLLAQHNSYISSLPYEFFFAKAGTATTTTAATNADYSGGRMNSNDANSSGSNPLGASTTSNRLSPDSFTTPPTFLPSSGGRQHFVGYSSRDQPLPVEGGLTDAGPGTTPAAFGSIPPLRFPSGAPAHHPPPPPHSLHVVEEDRFTDSHPDAIQTDPFSLQLDTSLSDTLVSQLHAQPLNINILSWKKQTIESILDGLEKGRIRVLQRPEERDVVFELELPNQAHFFGGRGGNGTVDIPRWPDVYPHSLQVQGNAVAFPTRSVGRNYSNDNATGSAGSEMTSWSGGGGGGGGGGRGEEEEPRDGHVRRTFDGIVKREEKRSKRHHRHSRNPSGSGSGSAIGETVDTPSFISGAPVVVAPLVHNHTLTPSPFRSHYQGYPASSSPLKSPHRDVGDNGNGTQTTPHHHPLAGVRHVGRPTVPNSTATTMSGPGVGVGAFLTTPTPTKKWTRRSSPDRIFMNVTLNGILRGAGMPIPRQKDDATRLPWSSIPQFLAENGMYIRGWPEANLPWLYSGDMGVKGTVGGHGGGGGGGATGGAGGIGEWRDRIDWKSSPSQRSYKPLAQALKNGDIQILPRPRGRDVLFEVRDAQGRCHDSTLGLSEEWKERWMRDAADGPPGLATVGSSKAGARHARSRVPDPRSALVDDEELEEDENRRGRPGYHSRSTSFSLSGSSRARNTAMDFELPSPTETSTSTGSGATKRQGPFSRSHPSALGTPPGPGPDEAPMPPRAGHQNLVYPTEHLKPSPPAYPYPGKSASSPHNHLHDSLHPSTPYITSYDRETPSSSSSPARFPPLVHRQTSDNVVRFRRPSFPPTPQEMSNNTSCVNTPSPDSSQRQRTVSLGTSSASTGTGTVLSGSSSGAPNRAGGGGAGRYNLPSLSHAAIDVDMDLDDPSLNHLPPIHLKSGYEDDESTPLAFPGISSSPAKRGPSAPGMSSTPPGVPMVSSSHPDHLPSPLVAFSRPAWSAAERSWKLTVLNPHRASLPPVGDTILWDTERRSWRLTWAADVVANSFKGQRFPAALWSTEQGAWILDSRD